MIAITNFQVVSNQKITPHVNHIRLRPENNSSFHFIPGQFITLHFEKDGQKFRRSYSIASIPGVDQTIDFAASYVPSGAGSQYLFALKPGDVTQVSGPFGRLILKEESLNRLFLIATGTGITPYRAMLPDLAERMLKQPELKVYIMQGVQYRNDVLYSNDFLAWAKQFPNQADYRTYLSKELLNERANSHEYSGYVQNSFEELTITAENEIVYLCGNPNMIDQAFAQLQSLGLPSSHIRREKYISSK